MLRLIRKIKFFWPNRWMAWKKYKLINVKKLRKVEWMNGDKKSAKTKTNINTITLTDTPWKQQNKPNTKLSITLLHSLIYHNHSLYIKVT